MTSPDAPLPEMTPEERAVWAAFGAVLDAGGDPVALFDARNVVRRATLVAARSASPDPDLDAAWKAAEAALPEGWTLYELSRSRGAVDWTAWTTGPWSGSGWPLGTDSGPTPAAALLALAARLSETPR